jgi:hypothetical protein
VADKMTLSCYLRGPHERGVVSAALHGMDDSSPHTKGLSQCLKIVKTLVKGHIRKMLLWLANKQLAYFSTFSTHRTTTLRKEICEYS